MRKFKVGDRVRVVTASEYAPKLIPVGRRGVVVAFSQTGSPQVEFGNGDKWYFTVATDGVIERDSCQPTMADDLTITPKARTILAHLKAGKTITPNEALVVYSNPRLASSIHEIRGIGYEVLCENRRDEQGHRYGRYSLKQKETVH